MIGYTNMEAVRGDWRSCLIQLYNIRWFKCTRYAAHVVHASCVVMCVNVTKSSLLSRYNDSTLCSAKYGVPASLSLPSLYNIKSSIHSYHLVVCSNMFRRLYNERVLCVSTNLFEKNYRYRALYVCVDLFVAVQDAICQLIWCQRLSDQLKFNYCLLVCHSLILFLFRRLPCPLYTLLLLYCLFACATVSNSLFE